MFGINYSLRIKIVNLNLKSSQWLRVGRLLLTVEIIFKERYLQNANSEAHSFSFAASDINSMVSPEHSYQPLYPVDKVDTKWTGREVEGE